jgi:hypothetical protein
MNSLSNPISLDACFAQKEVLVAVGVREIFFECCKGVAANVRQISGDGAHSNGIALIKISGNHHSRSPSDQIHRDTERADRGNFCVLERFLSISLAHRVEDGKNCVSNCGGNAEAEVQSIIFKEARGIRSQTRAGNLAKIKISMKKY